MHSYPSIYNVGHAAVQELFGMTPGREPLQLVIQEKVDGSQFSFGVLLENPDGGPTPPYWRLFMRSKGADLYAETKDKLFRPAIDTVVKLFAQGLLTPGWTYRSEVLSKPKHNTLAYERVPRGNVILFDVDKGEEDYLTPAELQAEAKRLDLEVVPLLAVDAITSLDQLKALLSLPSVLGGATLEGVVVKAYGRYGKDKKTLMAKYVSEEFKEVHRGEWKEKNPGRGDIVQELIDRYRMPQRWRKAVQHLRDLGRLTETPRDIGQLLIEVKADVLKEEASYIAATLLDHFWPQVARGITAGLPQWYKDELASKAFANEDAAVHAAPSIAAEIALRAAEPENVEGIPGRDW